MVEHSDHGVAITARPGVDPPVVDHGWHELGSDVDLVGADRQAARWCAVMLRVRPAART
jgi:hypothetical protein